MVEECQGRAGEVPKRWSVREMLLWSCKNVGGGAYGEDVEGCQENAGDVPPVRLVYGNQHTTVQTHHVAVK